jgi:hypothetical protein
MLRYALLFLLAFLTGLLCAQETRTAFSPETFEAEALIYHPPQRVGVSDQDYNYGTMVLRETVRQTGNDAKAFNVADYFNVLSAFLTLHEPEPDLRLAFGRFVHAPGSCEYLIEFWEKVKSNPKYDPIRDEWDQARKNCENNNQPVSPPPSIEAYAEQFNLNLSLLRLMEKMDKRDQRFRKGSYKPILQTPLDRKNERTIDSLYAVHGQYVGRSLVGEKYESVMWSVIQHSRLETMERYLPVLKRAVSDDQLTETPFRMLIDRVFTARTGQQVFGSQQGVELLPREERERICLMYGIDP